MRIVQFLQKPLLAFIAAVICCSMAFSQVKFTAISSNHTIGRGDYVQVEFIVENAKQIENFTTPSFPDFHVIEGPIQSSGMSVVNGNTSQYKGVSFVLQPIKLGKFTIAPATASVDGKMMHSNSISVEVNTSSPTTNNAPAALQPVWPEDPSDASREYFLKPGEDITEKIKKNLFVKVQVSKTTCYVGEPIVATYKLYSRLRSESRVTKRPSLNGFSVYDMIDPNSDAASVETLNGKQFAVHIIRKAQLIPLQAGTVELDPVEVENKVFFIRQNTSSHKRHSLLDEIFGQLPEESGTETDQNITLETKPLAITIKALPELNKPENFNGAVGHFTIDAKIENKKMNASGSGILKLTVKGTGNLPVVNAPQVKWPDSLEAYEPTAKEDVDKTIAPMGGSKTFEYAFSPQKKGRYLLAPVGFSYFDPATNSYKSLESDSLDFDVAAAAKQQAFSAQPAERSADGILSLLKQHLEWFFFALILAGLGVYLWRQNRRFKKADLPSKTATAVAQASPVPEPVTVIPEQTDPLLPAKRYLSEANYPAFYRELNQSLWTLIGASLELRASEMNKMNISRSLVAKGWDPESVALLQRTMSECEMNLYTPDYNEQNIQQLLDNADRLVNYAKEI